MKGMAPIAIRAANPGGREVPIQVRAEALRKWSDSAEAKRVMAGLGLMPDANDTGPDGDGPPQVDWLEEDVKRAIAAAEEAGLQSYRVEISPDGTIAIVVPAPPEG